MGNTRNNLDQGISQLEVNIGLAGYASKLILDLGPLEHAQCLTEEVHISPVCHQQQFLSKSQIKFQRMKKVVFFSKMS